MVAEAQPTDDAIIWTTAEDEVAFFNRQARALVDMSGADFRRRLAAGEFDAFIDDGEHSDYLYLAILARVAR
jgi:hypothetical protein